MPYEWSFIFLFLSICGFLICGPLGQQSLQLCKFSLFCWLLYVLVVWTRLGDTFVSQNPRGVCVSHSPGQGQGSLRAFTFIEIQKILLLTGFKLRLKLKCWMLIFKAGRNASSENLPRHSLPKILSWSKVILVDIYLHLSLAGLTW